jgi:hypothetical protein
MAVASARILSSDAYTDIANKIYIIIGVVMLFVLAYAILKAIIDPDQMTKGKLSAPTILKKIVIAVLGLALTPVFFNLMYQGQALFMEKDVITKLFFRTGNDAVSVGTIEDGNGNSVSVGTVKYNEQIKNVGGALTAASVWQAFFYPDGEDPSKIEADAGELYVKSAVYGIAAAATGTLAIIGAANGWNPVGWVCLGIAAIGAAITAISAHNNADTISQYTDKKITLEDAYGIASSTGNFYIFSAFVPKIIDGKINYIFILSSIAGCFVLSVFVSFSIDMGFRAAKLAYYQIIAPIPLILSVLPEFGENFNNYIKDVIRTFVEVFIRISVVYICIYIICHLTDLFSTTEKLWGNQDLTTTETVLALAALILGLVAFAKTAPNLIGEVFGMKSGSMKLGIREKLANGGLFTAGSIVGSTLTGMTNASGNMWRSDRFKDQKSGIGKLGLLVGAGARGALRGAFDSSYNRIREGKPVQSLKETIDKSARAGERAGDNEQRHNHGVTARREAREKVRKAREELDNAIARGNAAEIASAEEKLDEARKNAYATRYETSPLHDRAEAARKYFFGNADLKSDEQLLGAYSAGSKTKDTTRAAVATKFSNLKADLDRQDTKMSHFTLDDLTDADKASYMRRRNPGVAYASDAAAVAAFNAMSDEDKELGLTDKVKQMHAHRKKMNDYMETSEDFFWVNELARGEEKASKAANSILEQSYLWKQNASQAFEYQRKVFDDIAIDYDANGMEIGRHHTGTFKLRDETIRTTVGEFVRDYMGSAALEGRLDERQMAAALQAHDRVFLTNAAGNVVEVAPVRGADGKLEYHYTERTSSGTTASSGVWNEDEYSIQATTSRSVENQSASNIISNAFRRSHNRLSNYINQTKQRQRQASGGGGGGRK